MTFARRSPGGYECRIAGVEQKTLVHGDRTLTAEFRLRAGHTVPSHRHESEQAGYLVSGRMRLIVGDEIHECGPGDSWCIPGGVEHGAEIIEDSLAVEVFSPVRADYLPGR